MTPPAVLRLLSTLQRSPAVVWTSPDAIIAFPGSLLTDAIRGIGVISLPRVTDTRELTAPRRRGREQNNLNHGGNSWLERRRTHLIASFV